MESNFPSNSQSVHPAAAPPPGAKAAASKKKVEKVVTGEVIQRKKPLGKRFKDLVVGRNAKEAGREVVSNTLVPGLKGVLYDLGEQFLQRSLGVDRRRTGLGQSIVGGIFGSATYNAYNRVATPGGLPQDPRVAQQNTSLRGRVQKRDLQEILLPERGQATMVLDQMIAIIAQYGVASVSDLFELLGVTGEHTDEKWGWSDLMGADIQRVTVEGQNWYLLDLPSASPIER